MKNCPYLRDGGEMEWCQCMITDYGYWQDASVMYERPPECPNLDMIACFRMEPKEVHNENIF
jgi:hypothetical protein